MASIIVDNKKSGKYLRIVESYRDEEGKSRVKMDKPEHVDPSDLAVNLDAQCSL